MLAAEFNAKIQDGRIDIPVQYLNDFVSDVRVILLKISNTTPEQLFSQQMKDAANDSVFLSRTIGCVNDFNFVDSEVSGEW